MPNRFSTLLTIAALVAATNVYALVVRQQGFCNPGDIYCCNNVVNTTDSTAVQAATAVGLRLDAIQGPIGLACSPGSGIGVGGTGGSCAQEPLCCFNNSWGGLITVGCSPISISL